jgi:hypothetical protein
VDQWLQSRHDLLSPANRTLFSSDFLMQCGLSEG